MNHLPHPKTFIPTAKVYAPGTLGWIAKRAEKDVLFGVRSGLNMAKFGLGLVPLGVPLACIGAWLVWPAVDEDWKRKTFSFGGGAASDDEKAPTAADAPVARVHDGPAPVDQNSWVKEGVGAMPVLAASGATNAMNVPSGASSWVKPGIGKMPTLAADDGDGDDDE